MTPYRVTTLRATFGLGDLLRLTAAQFADRAASLAVITTAVKNTAKEKPAKDGYVDVRVIAPIEFKAGEVIGISEVPKHLKEHLQAVGKAAVETADEAAKIAEDQRIAAEAKEAAKVKAAAEKEAAKIAKAAAAAAEKDLAKATKAYDKSKALQKQFPNAAAYAASLKSADPVA